MLIPNPDLDFWNSDPKIHFWANLGQKFKVVLFCLKIGAHSISGMLILNPDLDFWNFDPKIHFWANLGPKSQRCSFCLKIGAHAISRMLILIPTLVSLFSNFKFLFGQIWAKLFILSKSLHTWYLEDADSYFNVCFLNFKLKIHFCPNLGQKSQICPFCRKIGTLCVLRMQILIPRLVSWILKPHLTGNHQGCCPFSKCE